MSLNIAREITREDAIRRYRNGQRTSHIAAELNVPGGTVHGWLINAGLIRAHRETESLAVREVKMAQPRVDRDPCPRCNTRKDIGCKHFPKVVAPMSVRDQAEALFR